MNFFYWKHIWQILKKEIPSHYLNKNILQQKSDQIVIIPFLDWQSTAVKFFLIWKIIWIDFHERIVDFVCSWVLYTDMHTRKSGGIILMWCKLEVSWSNTPAVSCVSVTVSKNVTILNRVAFRGFLIQLNFFISIDFNLLGKSYFAKMFDFIQKNGKVYWDQK